MNAAEAMAALVRLVATGRKLNAPAADVLAALEGLDGAQLAAITETLGDAAVQLVGKALALALEHERTVIDTRVLADIRPVLDDRTDEIVVVAATLEHSLRLTFAEDGQLVDRQYAMTTDGLRNLGVQIVRALEVDEVLAGICKDAGVQVAEL